MLHDNFRQTREKGFSFSITIFIKQRISIQAIDKYKNKRRLIVCQTWRCCGARHGPVLYETQIPDNWMIHWNEQSPSVLSMIPTYFPAQEDQLIVNAMDLFSAGSETTATTLAWAVAFMIIEPEVILTYSRVDGGFRQCRSLDCMC
jgi:hypothetical protein